MARDALNRPPDGGLDGIVDIEFAPPAATAAAWPIPAALAIVLLIMVALLLRRRNSARGRGLRAVRRLQRSPNHDRRTAFELATVLQRALKLSPLSANTALPATLQPQQSRWQAFQQRLSDARYAPAPTAPAEIEQLLQEARYWLRRWP